MSRSQRSATIPLMCPETSVLPRIAASHNRNRAWPLPVAACVQDDSHGGAEKRRGPPRERPTRSPLAGALRFSVPPCEISLLTSRLARPPRGGAGARRTARPEVVVRRVGADRDLVVEVRAAAPQVLLVVLVEDGGGAVVADVPALLRRALAG